MYSEYSESTLQLVGVAKTDQLGSNERIQEKIEKIKQFARAAPAVSSGDGAEVEGLRDALRAVQMRERELQQQLEDANMRVEQERERNKVLLLRYSFLVLSPGSLILSVCATRKGWEGGGMCLCSVYDTIMI